MRSATGRRAGSSRVYSLKPVALPMDHLPAPWPRTSGRGRGKQDSRRNSRDTQHTLVFVWEHLNKLPQRGFPVFEDPVRLRAARILAVARDEIQQYLNIIRVGDAL